MTLQTERNTATKSLAVIKVGARLGSANKHRDFRGAETGLAGKSAVFPRAVVTKDAANKFKMHI